MNQSSPHPLERIKCRGHSRQTGKPCKLDAVPDRPYCEFHGGNIPVGADLPQFKHGKYSKYLPARLLERYHESLNDPDLLNLKEQIAVCDARIAELFAGMDRGESGGIWRRLKDARQRSYSKDTGIAKAAMTEMDALILQGSTLSQVWDDIQGMQEHRRKLVDTERRRLQDMQATIPAARAVAFAVAVTQVIRKHVTDRPTLQAIQRDMMALLSRKDVNELSDGHERDDDAEAAVQ